ncbi:MAG: type II toxin-antitoxin system VapC family toxin [Desulfurococcales archaeon]|nr:type II toxin-antitoxin system VapC family toxin [Desulfurococcales archaeon]
MAVIAASHWNVTEAVVVFDEYERRGSLSAKRLLRALLRGSRILAGLLRLKLVQIPLTRIHETTELVLKHHIYSADALQIASAHYANCKYLVSITTDKRLAKAVAAENL